MARGAGVSTETNFNKGLITEVTGVNSPESSVTESINTIYDRRGRALTRKGFAYEEGFLNRGIGSTGARHEFLWETVSDNNSKDFVVVQVGAKLWFFEVVGSGSLSTNLEAFTVDLLVYKSSIFPDSDVTNTLCTFAVGKGYLFVSHPNCDTIYIKYNDDTNTITTNRITIQIRDFEGVEDGLNFDVRPSTLSTAHKYNLYNQGWYADAQISETTSVAIFNVLDYWDTGRDDFPANSDVWWYYTTVQVSGDSAGVEAMNLNTIDANKGFRGNTAAPKGHYIINALASNRTTLSGIPGVVETTSSGYRPSTVAFFTGRAFYGGVGKTGFSSTIYFSQIIEEDEQLGRCYQLNDPTSRESFDLLSSDGGTIKIQDINTILDMRVIGEALFVFATNGVWSITGSDNGPFRATDYTVAKVSSYPAVSKTSIVDVGGLPLWWNYEGIFSLKKSEIGLTSEVTNLTQTTIQQFYDDIPQDAKFSAKGSFNDQTGLIYWIYNTAPENGLYNYTDILVFDAITTAFYPLTIPQTATQISGILALRSSGEVFEDEVVVDQFGEIVTDQFFNQVTASVSVGFTAGAKIFKFVAYTGNFASFAEIRDESYLDWGTVPYECNFITGYRIRGDILKKQQTNYLTVITEEIEDGSCYVQSVWDYANSHDSGRFSNPQQVYRQRLLRDYQRSRLQMRGTGYSLQFKFFGEAGKPYIIVGWAGFDTTEAMP